MKAVFALVAVCTLGYIAVATVGVPPCMPSDYKPMYRSCSADGTRTVSFENRFSGPDQGGNCMGPEVLHAAVSTVPCQCTISEYMPQYSECTNGKRKLLTIGIQGDCIADSTMVSGLVQNNEARDYEWPCECNADDVTFEYTKCRSDGSQALVSFWRRPCMAGDIKLPAPVLIPCNEKCFDGEYMKAPLMRCEKCPMGTFSSTFERYGPFYNIANLPDNTVIQCTGEKCAKWGIQDDYLHSGITSETGPMTSVMKFITEVKQYPSSVRFTFKLGTPTSDDLFQVSVDGAMQFERSGTGDWNDAQVFLASSKDCGWHLQYKPEGNVVCLESNELVPFNAMTQLNKTSAPFHVPLVRVDDSCNHKGYDSGIAKGAYVVLKFSGDCEVNAQIERAQSAGALGVIFADKTAHVGGSSDKLKIPVAQVARQGGEDPQDFYNSILTTEAKSASFDFTNLTPHMVEVSFKYTKKSSGSSKTPGVMIKTIDVIGTRAHSTECTKCPPGTASLSGKGSCTACPAGTYAKNAGTPWPCHQCPYGSESPVGASSCRFVGRCTVDDYDIEFGNCKANAKGEYTRSIAFVKRYTSVCNVSAEGGFLPPLASEVDCVACSPGTKRNEDGTCGACATGEYLDPATQKCSKCAATQLAVRKLVFNSFEGLHKDSLPPRWAQTCEGCSSTGWRVTTLNVPLPPDAPQTVIAVGRSVSEGGSASLYANATVIAPGALLFGYALQYDDKVKTEEVNEYLSVHMEVISANPSTYGAVLLTERVEVDKTAGTINAVSPTSLIPPGEWVVKWTYRLRQAPPSTIAFAITKFSMENEAYGAASSCVDCPAGHSCGSGVAQVCPTGTYSKDAKCVPCPAGTVAVDEGASVCTPCSQYLKPDSTGAYCDFPEKGSLGNGYDAENISPQLNSSISVRQRQSPEPVTIHLSIDDPAKLPVVGPSCKDVAGFGCFVTQGKAFSLGNVITVASTPAFLAVNISGGTCYNTALKSSAALAFICQDRANLDFGINNIVAKEVAPCQYLIDIIGLSGCSPCKEEDYSRAETTECIDGKVTETYYREKMCHGGYVPPDRQKIPCKIGSIRVEAGFSTFWAVVMAIFLLIVLLGTLAFTLRHRNIALAKKYDELVGQNRGNEMQTD